VKIIALGAAVLALSAPLFAHAQSRTDDQTVSVAVHYGDLDLSRPHEAAVLLDRVGQASLEACGASEFSAPEYKAAVRDSECYRANVQQAVAAIGAPAVTSLYTHRSAEVSVGTK
jgi:UrcA family protein